MTNEIEDAIQEALDAAKEAKKSAKRIEQRERAEAYATLNSEVDTFIENSYEAVTTLIANGRSVINLADLPENITEDFKTLLIKKITELAKKRATVEKNSRGDLILRVEKT